LSQALELAIDTLDLAKIRPFRKGRRRPGWRTPRAAST
jgi:hypothetical protein